jgi:hypothetical protein
MVRSAWWMLILVAAISSVARANDVHRVVVLDAGVRRGVDNHRLLLLEIESGNVLANVELGAPTNVAVSVDGHIVAALTSIRDGEKRRERLDFYRASDLGLLRSGWLPESIAFPGRLKLGVAANIHFSPDAKEIVFCGLAPPEPATVRNVDFATTVITRVKSELDEARVYRTTVAAKIMPCRGVDFVSVAAWPRVVVMNPTATELLTINLENGDVVDALPLAEAGPSGYLPLRMRGIVESDGGRFAYFLPRKPGELKKIDLTQQPPAVVHTVKNDFNVRFSVATVSEAAKRIFALEDRLSPTGLYEPSRWVSVFLTSGLGLEQRIEAPLADCHWLAASRDGRYLYATGPERGPPFAELSIGEARLAVMDAATGRLVKIVSAGQHPAIVLAVEGE